ncbi:MAG: hypothetical protein AAF721_37685 [Myxococcota bacterium]
MTPMSAATARPHARGASGGGTARRAVRPSIGSSTRRCVAAIRTGTVALWVGLAGTARAGDDPGAAYAEPTDAARGARAIAHFAVAPALPDDYPTGTPRPYQPIEDPTGHALEHFFAALTRTDAKEPGALTRVMHMGDSSIGLDGLPHAIRTRLQDRFGDGGPGFLLLTRYNPNYASKVARLSSGGHWDVCYIAYRCRRDGGYGLGGHVFRGQPGSTATIRTRRRGKYGTEASRFELWYATSPRGGKATLTVDDGDPVIVDTRGDTVAARWTTLSADRGGHALRLRVDGGQYVWAYGVVAETEGPGLVWDTMSMIGAYTKRLHAFDDAHIAEQVAHRDANLLVLNYGGNDLRRLVSGRAEAAEYQAELSQTIVKLRRGKPEMSCLVVSVIDHGKSGDKTVRRHHIKTMVAAQRKAAFDNGCAFFDSVAAMGGPGSVRKWKRRRPALAAADLKHLSPRGRDLMGARIVASLLARYEAYAAEQADAAAASPGASP